MKEEGAETRRLGVGTHTFTSTANAADVNEFKSSLLYRLSSRPSKAAQGDNAVSKFVLDLN